MNAQPAIPRGQLGMVAPARAAGVGEHEDALGVIHEGGGLGEVRRGIELIARRDKAQAEMLERWYASMRQQLRTRVLPVDEPVMMMWSRISVPDPLPAYDGLIAATALVNNMTVATRNTVDFRRVGVTVVDPWSDRRLG